MAPNIFVPADYRLENLGYSDAQFHDLVRQAKAGDGADRSLALLNAIQRYKKAVFWAMFLSASLIMEGYDFVLITSFYGQTQFKRRFGIIDHATGRKLITPAWQSGLTNASLIGQLLGLALNGYVQDRFGCRYTMMFFMAWMFLSIFAVVFAPSLPMLAFGEVLCGIPWGGLQTLTTSYASEVVPSILRPYLTTYVSMCWGFGILLCSGVIRAVVGINSDLAWKLPFALQWVWPLPLLFGAYLAPESPWNLIRREKLTEAKESLARFRNDTLERQEEVDRTVAYMLYTTELEKMEASRSSYLECFRGTNLRRTEINCVIWAGQILCGNAILGYSVLFLQRSGFSEIAAFNINISLSSCYMVGGVVCWLLFPYLGRATIYMCGLTFMFFVLVAIGALGCAYGEHASLAIGVLLVISTFVNKVTIGPITYTIASEIPSGRLRYKSIVIGKCVYNLTAIFHNSVTPRMLSPMSWNWGAKAAFFYAGTNLACNIWCWFRLPETKNRSFGEINMLFENHIPARQFKHTGVGQFPQQNITQLTGNGASATQVARVLC